MAADLAVAWRGLGILGAGGVSERADLLEAPGIEQPVDVLADRELAALVKTLDSLLASQLVADQLAALAELAHGSRLWLLGQCIGGVRWVLMV
jgi:hypothetical protein